MTPPPSGSGSSGGGRRRMPRPHIGVLFECCNVYTRIYRDRNGERYSGRCPRCQKAITFQVGPGGTDNRMFRAR